MEVLLPDRRVQEPGAATRQAPQPAPGGEVPADYGLMARGSGGSQRPGHPFSDPVVTAHCCVVTP